MRNKMFFAQQNLVLPKNTADKWKSSGERLSITIFRGRQTGTWMVAINNEGPHQITKKKG